MHFEIIVRHVDGGNIISEKLIKEIEIKKPESIIDIGFRHAEQVKIMEISRIHTYQFRRSYYLRVMVFVLNAGVRLKKWYSRSIFHSALSDHKLTSQGYSCSCGWQSKSTIHGIFDTNVYPDLIKTQATLGAKMPYKEAEYTLAEFNCASRSVNNHIKIAEATNKVGDILNDIKLKETITKVAESKVLYLHVDGGHIKDKIELELLYKLS